MLYTFIHLVKMTVFEIMVTFLSFFFLTKKLNYHGLKEDFHVST